MDDDIIQMPRPAEAGATRWQVWGYRIREWLSHVANRLHLPGAITDTTIDDELSGQKLQVRTVGLFTCLSVNGRDYYFHRFTGKFDGTGTSCSLSPDSRL